MQVPLLDLKPQYAQIRGEIQAAIAELCASQQFILGQHVEELEKQVAAYCQCKYACAVSSGTDALLMALMVENIGPGDEVITSPYTFFATAGAISRAGARPVFVDICHDTCNINTELIEAAITPRTKAIIPVHLYGQMADMDAIMTLAERYQLVVIEDAAQAIGAQYKERVACSMGHYGCLSFFPSKNLGAFGDAGMILCNDKGRAEKLKICRSHGSSPKYYHQFIGGNFRMDAMQAVVLHVKLKYLDTWTSGRQKNADDYQTLLAKIPNLTLPVTAATTTRHVFNQYVIRIHGGRRQAVWDGLKAADIGCDVYYPVPLHMQQCYAFLGYHQGDFPESERAAAETLALPIYPELSHIQKRYVADTLSSLCN